jgi:hypothetical protein
LYQLRCKKILILFLVNDPFVFYQAVLSFLVGWPINCRLTRSQLSI